MNKPAITIPRLDFSDCPDCGSVVARMDALGNTYIVDEVPWKDNYPYRPLALATLAHDSEYIYASFLVRSKSIKAIHLEDQKAVCDDSCMEFFIKPEPDGEYFNFEFNCLGTMNASHRESRTVSTRLTAEQGATVLRFPAMPRESFEERQGLATWELLVKIPLVLMGIGKEDFPKAMRGNLYACASGMKEPYYLSYFPISAPKPNYHLQEFFGIIVLE